MRPGWSPPGATPRGSSARPSAAPTRRCGSTRPTIWSPRSRTHSAAKGPSYVFDPLWGEPAAAAIQAAAPHATIVNLGQSAGATSELASAAVRFKSLSILGHTNFAVPADELAEHYRRLVGLAMTGEIRLDVERIPLDQVADAWRRQAEGAGAKLVLLP